MGACSENNNIGTTEPDDALIDLEFSTSPIDLQGLDVKYVKDISYGQHADNQFDIFLPNSQTPTSLVIFIHGGGFTGGDKAFVYTNNYPSEIRLLLSNNIAVATINYRLIQVNDDEGVLKSLNDSKKALQYIRYIHQELNIDPDKIGLFGSSAGASTSLWIGANDDFQDVNNVDPVLRESTRVSCIALRATQSSLDIEGRWLSDVFGDFNVSIDDLLLVFGTEQLFNFYGVQTLEEYRGEPINTYRKQVDMLSLLTSDDPEIWVTNLGGHNDKPQTESSWYHHPFHAREIKEFAESMGISVVAAYGSPVLFDNLNNESYVDFFIRKL